MYYSKQTGGFYDPVINAGKIPADAVSITTEQWRALLQSQSQGKEIKADGTGKPVTADREPGPRYVPYSVPKAKAKIVLAAAGLLAPLLAYIDSLPDDDRNKIAFLDIADWERDSPTLIALAKNVLKLTDEGIDAFFIAADAEIL